MVEKINLQNIKTKTIHAHYEDGLWDIMMGFILFASAFAPAMHLFGGVHRIFWYFAFFGIGFAIWYFGKRFITTPRIGRVKLSTRIAGSRTLLLSVVSISVLLTAFLVILTASQNAAGIEPPAWFALLGGMIVPIGAGLFAIMIIGFVAYRLKLNRVYAYALMFGFSIMGAELLFNVVGSPLDGILTFGISGTVMVLVGLGYFIRFIKKYNVET